MGTNSDAKIFLLTYAAARLIVKKAGNLESLLSDLITSANILLFMHPVQAHPWKLCQSYCYAVRICQPLKSTLGARR
mgnify:CR=1 FL=1